MFVDDGSIYWAAVTSEAFLERRVAKAGATRMSLVAKGTNSTLHFVMDASYVYWTAIGGIQRAPLAGGATDTFFGAKGVGEILLDGSNLVATIGASVATLPLAGGPKQTIATVECHSAAADETSYFCRGAAGVVRRIPKDGSAVVDIGNNATGLLARSGTKLFVESKVAGSGNWSRFRSRAVRRVSS